MVIHRDHPRRGFPTQYTVHAGIEVEIYHGVPNFFIGFWRRQHRLWRRVIRRDVGDLADCTVARATETQLNRFFIQREREVDLERRIVTGDFFGFTTEFQRRGRWLGGRTHKGARAEERLEEVVIGVIDRAVDLAVFGEIAGGVLEDKSAVGAGFSQIRRRGEAAQLRFGKGGVTRRRRRIAREAGEFEER